MYFIFQVSKPNWIRLSYPSHPQRNAGSMAVGTDGDVGAEIVPPDFGRKTNAGCRVGGTGGAGDEIAPPDFVRKRNADSNAVGTGGAGNEIVPPDCGRKRNAGRGVGGTGGAGDEIAPPDFGRKRNADSRADGTGVTGGEIAPPFARKRSKSCSIRIFNITACPLKLVFYEFSHFRHFAVGFSLQIEVNLKNSHQPLKLYVVNKIAIQSIF